jgi:acetyl esterase/lipase
VVFYGVFDLTNPRYRTIIERVVLKAKYGEMPERFLRASPITRVTPDAPAFVVVHGAEDTVAPVEDARRFVERLRAVSRRPVLYLEVKGAEHAFDMLPSVRNVPIVESIAAFLTSLHRAHEARSPAGAARCLPAVQPPGRTDGSGGAELLGGHARGDEVPTMRTLQDGALAS